MTILLIILFFFLVVAAAAGGVFYWRYRSMMREQKNIERGLKMVPLLIHLPPISEDTQGGGRDARDVVEENISKAQVLYNIIASTVQKGFKSKFYGQRHFGFEIVGTHGFVQFYAAVPVVLIDVVKQAVVSAYPSARLEEVPEHNIFSPIGKLNATIGGELSLKDNFAYPIATFQDLKRDGLQSLLNALSTLDKDDGAGIQILMRPADPGWAKKAQGLAGNKRKGDDKKKGAALMTEWGKQLATAAVKPPEAKEGGEAPKPKELSSHEQNALDAIDQKTAHPGYEVLIRVIASSNISHRAQSILGNIVASFALYDAPGRNGFKYTPAKDIESFVTAYILRLFPQENNQNILNSVELATLFHFPDEKNIPTSQLERQTSKQVDGPRNITDKGLFLGYNVFRGVKKPIRLDDNDRRRHMYLVGQTGTGKSTLLENLALQDMLNGKGFAFIDPHGDEAERLLAMVPKERTEDVIYFCPADMDYPLGLNLFEYDTPDQKDFLIQEAINMLYKLYDPQHTGIVGPRYEHWFRNAALTVMSNPEGGTFIDIPKVFTDKAYERQLKAHVTDQTVLDFWNKEMAQTSDYHKSEVLGWFVSKFGAFLSNEMMRNIIGQSKSAFNLRQIMDDGKILLVNLSKGRTGELNSMLLGMIFVMKFQAAAMSRANVPEDQRPDFSLYVDEFQSFSTDSFANILSEARKYHLNLIVANQFTTQLSDEIRDAVFGNIGTVISYRVGTNDAEFLAKQFAPVFDTDDLQRIPNYNSVVRMLIGGIPAQPFSMAGMPPLGTPNSKLAEALKQLSAAKFGRPKGEVEKEIFARLRPKEEARPAGMPSGVPPQYRTAPPGARPPMPPSRPAPSAAPSTGSSFLDDWLSKRKSAGSAVPNMAPAAARPGPPAGVPSARPAAPVAAQPPAPPFTTAPAATAPATPPLAPPPPPPIPPATPAKPEPAKTPEPKSKKISKREKENGHLVLKPTPQKKFEAPKEVLEEIAENPPATPTPTPVPAAPLQPQAQLADAPKSEDKPEEEHVERVTDLEQINKLLNHKEEIDADTSAAAEEILRNKPASKRQGEPDPEDTIFIDATGTLHIKQDDKPEDKPADKPSEDAEKPAAETPPADQK